MYYGTKFPMTGIALALKLSGCSEPMISFLISIICRICSEHSRCAVNGTRLASYKEISVVLPLPCIAQL